jgi:hypothetical protein
VVLVVIVLVSFLYLSSFDTVILWWRFVHLIVSTLLPLSPPEFGEIFDMPIDWKKFETVFRLLAAVHAVLGEDAVSLEIFTAFQHSQSFKGSMNRVALNATTQQTLGDRRLLGIIICESPPWTSVPQRYYIV